ncbi:hypothetical protein MIN45_P1479 [Methylomarinovum tepidoasis]|uniref:Ig-like domain-containing protein n=1 Tax=Methylomarinovum tepidoasis TaxID=2840183 RepID=A0AAU9D295_9GAMM|nr:hypothetical protein [Methylomarinovum sp. IN45]BCX89109.1 hypothetical protein MIN45_P1479 [Methylomarinovum sp. IN45]
MTNRKTSWNRSAIAGLFSFFLALVFSHGAIAAGAIAGEWQPAAGVTVEKGSRFYDTGERVYYTINTLTNTSGKAITGPLRLLVTSASHTVTNDDGEENGQPYFDVLVAEEVLEPGAQRQVTIKFQPRRARFAYEVEAQVFVAPADSDGDGIPDGEDLCPNDPQNACFSVSGEVYGGGAALTGASVVIGLNSVQVATDAAGRFTATGVSVNELATDGLNRFFPVRVSASGYSSGYAKAVLVPGTTNYEVIVRLDPVSDQITEDDDVSQGVPIQEDGQTVGSLKIPTDALPVGVTKVTGTVTYLDPETELDAAPGGDLLALPPGSDPNAAPVPLESFGMMEFDLRDQDGNPIHQLGGTAEVCMKATSGLQVGDTVPLWYYDESRGLWIEEGQGTVEDRNGQLMICGQVSHFTWWNYDQPVDTHSCFKYKFVDENSGADLDFMDWYAEGVTYNGTSPERACNRDADDPETGGDTISSLTVKKSSATQTEQIRVYTYLSGVKYYLVRDGDGTYSLSQNIADAAVFDDPQDQGSCLTNQNVENCRYLDYQDVGADGVLPLSSDINYPPVITDFFIDNQSLLIGQSTDVHVTVTDPEDVDPVTVEWSYNCWDGTGGSLVPNSDSGPSPSTFTATFTSPSTVSGYGLWCQITVTASDAAGNTSTAENWVTVHPSQYWIIIDGTLYGTDGNPMPNAPMTFYGCSESQWLSTDDNGAYHIEADMTDCFTGYYGEGFAYGEVTIEVPYEHEAQSWSRSEHLYPDIYSGCSELSDGIHCQHDIHLPVVWGALQGALLGSYDSIDLWRYSYDGDYFGYDWTQISIPEGSGSYGPVSVPLGEISMMGYETGTGSGYWLYTVMPSTDGARQDFGPAGSASVVVTVFDGDGNPLANVGVSLWSDNGNSSSATTDGNGQVTFTGIPLGLVYVSSDSPYYSGGALITENNETVYIDLGGSDTCQVTGTAYGWDGQPVAGVEVDLWNEWTTGEFNSLVVTTDPMGGFSFDGIYPGWIGWSDYYGYYYALAMPISHCRPESGSPRVIRFDRPPLPEVMFMD